jgi:hypothetical protein
MTIAEHLDKKDLKLIPPENLTPEQLAAWNAAYGPENAAYEKADLSGEELVRWKYQRHIKDYLRCVAAVDDSVGTLLKFLDDSGLARDTVVIYSSDQGFYLGDHGWFDKRWMYEESLKMPLIVRWPGVVEPGSIDKHLVQNLDYAETFLEIAGVEIPREMQGQSLVPLLRGEDPADWRKSIYYHYFEYPGPHSVRRHYGVRTERYKLIRYYEIDEWELFDLEKDPDELRSLHGDPAYAAVRSELETELRRLQALYRDLEPEKPLEELEQENLTRLARAVALRQVFALEKADGGAVAKPPRARDLNPAGKPITAGAWCTTRAGDGVILAQGGESLGYALYLAGGKPRFAVRNHGVLKEVEAKEGVALGKEIHIGGVLTADGELRILVGGVVAGTARGHLIAEKPADGLSIGDDTGSRVAEYKGATKLDGELTDIRLYWGILDDAGMQSWLKN